VAVAVQVGQTPHFLVVQVVVEIKLQPLELLELLVKGILGAMGPTLQSGLVLAAVVVQALLAEILAATTPVRLALGARGLHRQLLAHL
jgi:hypothetical protein